MHPLEQWIRRHVKAVYSPYHELLVSLHVLVNPDHHLSRLNWVRNVHQNMDREMVDQILFYGKVTEEWFFAMDCEAAFYSDSRYVEESIEKWNVISEIQFCRFILGKSYEQSTSRQSKEARDILRRPKWHQKRLYHLLQAYQKDFFARELYAVEPWLVKAVNSCNTGFQEHPIETLRSIHPRFLVKEKYIQFLKARTYQFNYSDLNSITILPSTFIAPHLLIDTESPDIKVDKQVIIPSTERVEETPQDLLRALKALADPTRLIMVRAMLYHPYCTQQLTEKVKLAKATVSKHLKVLEKSGLIRSERSSHYVFYRTNAYLLEMIRVDMDQFFDQPKIEKEEQK